MHVLFSALTSGSIGRRLFLAAGVRRLLVRPLSPGQPTGQLLRSTKKFPELRAARLLARYWQVLEVSAQSSYQSIRARGLLDCL